MPEMLICLWRPVPYCPTPKFVLPGVPVPTMHNEGSERARDFAGVAGRGLLGKQLGYGDNCSAV